MAVLFIALASTTAKAAPVTLHFLSGAGAGPAFSVRGSVTYDSATPPLVLQHTSTSSVAVYRPVNTRFSFEVQDATGTPVFGKTDFPLSLSIVCQKLTDESGSQDVFAVNAQFSDGTMVFVSVADSTGTMLADVSLPTSSPVADGPGSWLVNRGLLFHSGSPVAFSDVAPGGSDAGLLQQIAQLQAALDAAINTIVSLEEQQELSELLIAALQGRIAQQEDSLASLAELIAGASGDPAFAIPGDTPEEQIESLAVAVAKLNHGQQKALYDQLTGRKSR